MKYWTDPFIVTQLGIMFGCLATMWHLIWGSYRDNQRRREREAGRIDPMERYIAEALDKAGVEYLREKHGIKFFGFYLPQYGVFIEPLGCFEMYWFKRVKADNVIFIRGYGAAEAFAEMIQNQKT